MRNRIGGFPLFRNHFLYLLFRAKFFAGIFLKLFRKNRMLRVGPYAKIPYKKATSPRFAEKWL